MYSLTLFAESNINPAFVRANLAILKKHQQQLAVLETAEDKLKKLTDLWKSEYNAELDDRLKIINFKSEADLTMFLVRWS